MLRRGTFRGLAFWLAAAGLLVALPAQAQSWAQEQSLQCDAAIAAAEARRATLPGLLLAVAKAESGRPIPPMRGLQPWPWAVNADGGAYYFDSKDAALAWVRNAQGRGVTQIDVGCMQINLQSHRGAFSTLEQAFDPAANADYAARFLIRLHDDAGGNWFDAIGHYHSRTPQLAADYRIRVSAIAQGRTPPAGSTQLLYVRAMQQGTLRIPLAGGGALRINTRRQPSRSNRRMDACQVANVLGEFMPPQARLGARARCFAGR